MVSYSIISSRDISTHPGIRMLLRKVNRPNACARADIKRILNITLNRRKVQFEFCGQEEEVVLEVFTPN